MHSGRDSLSLPLVPHPPPSKSGAPAAPPRASRHNSGHIPPSNVSPIHASRPGVHTAQGHRESIPVPSVPLTPQPPPRRHHLPATSVPPQPGWAPLTTHPAVGAAWVSPPVAPLADDTVFLLWQREHPHATPAEVIAEKQRRVREKAEADRIRDERQLQALHEQIHELESASPGAATMDESRLAQGASPSGTFLAQYVVSSENSPMAGGLTPPLVADSYAQQREVWERLHSADGGPRDGATPNPEEEDGMLIPVPPGHRSSVAPTELSRRGSMIFAPAADPFQPEFEEEPQGDRLREWLDGRWKDASDRHELAATTIQCAYRVFVAKSAAAVQRLVRRRVLEEVLKLEEPSSFTWEFTWGFSSERDSDILEPGHAERVARAMRGFYSRVIAVTQRKRLINERKAIEEERLRAYAVLPLQAMIRRWLGRRRRFYHQNPAIVARHLAKERETSAMIAQRVVRGFLVRRRIRRWLGAVITLQAAYRRHLAQVELRRNRTLRRDDEHAAVQEYAAGVLQRFFCLVIGRKWRRLHRHADKLAHLTRVCRGYQGRVFLSKTRTRRRNAAARKIQNCARGFLATLDIRRRLAAAQSHKAAGVIGRFMLAQHSRSKRALEHAQATKAAVQIQRIWRGFRDRKRALALRQQQMERRASATSDASGGRPRSRRSRGSTTSLDTAVKSDAATAIQTQTRGYLARKKRGRRTAMTASENPDVAAVQTDAATIMARFYRERIRRRFITGTIQSAAGRITRALRQMAARGRVQARQAAVAAHLRHEEALQEAAHPIASLLISEDTKPDAVLRESTGSDPATAPPTRSGRAIDAGAAASEESPEMALRQDAAVIVQRTFRTALSRTNATARRTDRREHEQSVRRNEAAEVVTRFMRRLAALTRYRQVVAARKAEVVLGEEGSGAYTHRSSGSVAAASGSLTEDPLPSSGSGVQGGGATGSSGDGNGNEEPAAEVPEQPSTPAVREAPAADAEQEPTVGDDHRATSEAEVGDANAEETTPANSLAAQANAADESPEATGMGPSFPTQSYAEEAAGEDSPQDSTPPTTGNGEVGGEGSALEAPASEAPPQAVEGKTETSAADNAVAPETEQPSVGGENVAGEDVVSEKNDVASMDEDEPVPEGSTADIPVKEEEPNNEATGATTELEVKDTSVSESAPAPEGEAAAAPATDTPEVLPSEAVAGDEESQEETTAAPSKSPEPHDAAPTDELPEGLPTVSGPTPTNEEDAPRVTALPAGDQGHGEGEDGGPGSILQLPGLSALLPDITTHSTSKSENETYSDATFSLLDEHSPGVADPTDDETEPSSAHDDSVADSVSAAADSAQYTEPADSPMRDDLPAPDADGAPVPEQVGGEDTAESPPRESQIGDSAPLSPYSEDFDRSP